MNRLGIYIIAIIFALVILLFTCTFQVRFNESAIVTTFGRAGEDSQVTEPGLHVKWPYPIQSVRKYDTRTRVLETRIENVVTKDNQLVAVQIFLKWRIADVLRYFQNVETDTEATTRLTDRLRSNLGVFSRFDFGELLTQAEMENNLGTAEEQMLQLLVEPASGSPSVLSYGIEPLGVGVTRLILPEGTSTAVFERMQQTRQRLAANARTAGEAEAQRIRQEAETAAEKIRSFAQRRASAIKRVGDQQAAQYLSRQAELDVDFAIFLRQIEAIERMVKRGTTFVFPAKWPFNLLIEPPVGGVNGAALERRLRESRTAEPDFSRLIGDDGGSAADGDAAEAMDAAETTDAANRSRESAPVDG